MICIFVGLPRENTFMKKYCFAIAAILTSVTLCAQSPAIEETTGPDLQTVENSATKAAETPAIKPVTPAVESPATRSFRPTISSYFEMRADAKLPKQNHLVNAHLANLYVNAQLTESLSFHWRVRFSKWYGGQSLINSSDFLYLKWQPFEHLRFKAGRECLYIGGYEYEQAPIDIFYTSEFCNNVAPYKFTATVDIVGENDTIGFQVGETPFGKKGVLLSTMWTGNHGFFESLWSLNAGENLDGSYSWLIGLGNKFHLTENLTFFLDYTDRLHGGLLKDFTLVPKLTYRPCSWLRTRLEGSIDYNDSGISNYRITAADACQYFCSIPDKFRCVNAGIQLEFFPFKPLGDDLRFHIAYNHRNTHNFGTDVFADTDCLNLGVTYKLRSRR
jgi:hypothetical protein